MGPLTEKQQQLVQTLEVIRIEQMIPPRFRVPGRPPKDRAAMARALVAKAVYDMPTTRVLLDRLDTDVVLRRICGWEGRSEVPSESVFSRAFAEFSDTQLPQRVHEALIWNTHRDRLVGHLSRASTAIEAREKPAAKQKAPPPPKRKRGQPKKGEERPKVLKRLDRQATMSLPAMLDDLPTDCDVGMKKESKGYKSTWVGYKLHIDVADGQIPISCLLTSASLHDSQAAIPLATLSAERTTNLYDLMDAAYDAEPIRRHSRSLGHDKGTGERQDAGMGEGAIVISNGINGQGDFMPMLRDWKNPVARITINKMSPIPATASPDPRRGVAHRGSGDAAVAAGRLRPTRQPTNLQNGADRRHRGYETPRQIRLQVGQAGLRSELVIVCGAGLPSDVDHGDGELFLGARPGQHLHGRVRVEGHPLQETAQRSRGRLSGIAF